MFPVVLSIFPHSYHCHHFIVVDFPSYSIPLPIITPIFLNPENYETSEHLGTLVAFPCFSIRADRDSGLIATIFWVVVITSFLAILLTPGFEFLWKTFWYRKNGGKMKVYSSG